MTEELSDLIVEVGVDLIDFEDESSDSELNSTSEFPFYDDIIDDHAYTGAEKVLPKLDPDKMNRSFMNLRSYRQMMEVEIRYTAEQVEALDFKELQAGLLRKKCDMLFILNEIFKTSGRSFTSIIVEYAQNLFDGYWFTTERSFFCEITPGDVVGFFSDPPSIQYFVGRVKDSEILIRQFRPGKSKLPLIIAGRMSNTKAEIDAHFRTNYQIDAEVNTLSFVRNPPVYQRALYLAGMGDLDGLKALVRDYDFDVTTKKPEAQNYTVMRLAKLKNHVNIVKWLIGLKTSKGILDLDESETEDISDELVHVD